VAEGLAGVLSGRRYRLRRTAEKGPDGSRRHVYGDKNQYFKMATLLTHLGLILFLAGGAVTAGWGYETVVFVGEGQTAPVQPVGTPDNMLVKNISFEAPTRPDGSFIDFRTDLAVYQNGEQIARKTIRVNDPLELNGFVFHQNTFGPAAELVIHDPDGRLVWDGPVLLAGELGGLPQGFLTIPGSNLGLLLVMDRTADGVPLLALTGLAATDDPDEATIVFLRGLGLGATTDPAATGGYAINWQAAGAYTGMVIKRDPGQRLIWLAYLSLISGLALTFYFPRRRVWARFADGRLELAMTAERYVDVEREFEQLLDELAKRLGQRPERRLQQA
jgi:cytochrome c biogenesis protein